MENQKEESASTQLIQRLSPLNRELQPASSPQELQKQNRPELPPHEGRAPPQFSERSKNANPSRLSFQPIFPQDIIVEIFSALPVASLLRFRCLSKSCKSLIADPFFIKKHLDKSQDDPKFTKERIFFNTWNIKFRTCSIRSCSLRAILEDQFINSVEVVDPLKTTDRSDLIVGSCDGLICIDAGQGSLFLLNPTLRACRRLPNLGLKETNKDSYRVYGFGYDASTDDYKVVRIFPHYKDGHESIVRVYSLRTNYWRRIQNFAFGAPPRQAGIHVDGSLHWSLSRLLETSFSWIIVSLDLARETYNVVPQPAYRHDANMKTLTALNGCLCVMCDYDRMYVDIWVMMEYGKRESWTMLLTMPYPYMPSLQTNMMLSGTTITPLHVSANEILMFSECKVFLYNPKEDTIRIPENHWDPDYYIYGAVNCVESLVSPTVVNQRST